VPASHDPGSPPGLEHWATVGRYPSRALAQVAASLLEADGLRARVVGDDALGLLPDLAPGRGGVEVQVPAPDAELATSRLRALEEPTRRTPEATRSRWRAVVGLVLAVAVLVAVASAFLTGPSLLDL
jgi:hypothetical protein